MNQIVLQRTQRVMLVLAIILLPLTNLPKAVTFSSIGKTASLYPLYFSLLLFLVENFKYRFTIRKSFTIFVSLYILWQIVCLVNGALIYQYYDLIASEQVGVKLKYLIKYAPGIIDEAAAIKIWLVLRESKNIVFQAGILFLIPIQILHLYQQDFERAFKDMRRAVNILICMFGIYSIPEIMFLKFNNANARMILEWINPFLYDVQNLHGWWPPLLWWGQLRSLCAEPSFFGILASFCVPFCWSYLYEKRNVKYILLYVYFIFMLFMTKARTALGIYVGEITLLFISCLYVCNKKYLQTIMIILISSAVAFSVNLLNWKTFSNSTDASMYINNNIISVADPGARSNTARLANVMATIKVGAEHPFFGVGKGFRSAYITDKLPEWSYNNMEVRNWARYLSNEGFLKSGYPILNYYASVFAESGLLGLVFFLLPVFYIFYNALKKRKALKHFNVIITLIVLCGQLAAMLSNTYFLTYPLSLGLALLLVESKGK